MHTIRIFISSPGDVSQERERASQVIQSLQRRYSRKFHLAPVFWENLPLEPDMSFQQGIDLFLKNPGVDFAVFILWSRLGSPLEAAIRKADGSTYLSGTEREYDLISKGSVPTNKHWAGQVGAVEGRMLVPELRISGLGPSGGNQGKAIGKTWIWLIWVDWWRRGGYWRRSGLFPGRRWVFIGRWVAGGGCR